MFFLSWRQLMARKKQTLLILLGISFGTLLFVAISGVQLGMRRYIADALLNNTAHVLISGSENNIERAEVSERLYPGQNVHWISEPMGKRENSRLANVQGWYERLHQDARVYDYSPRLSISAILSRGEFTQPVTLIGTIPEKQVRISGIKAYMKEGAFEDLRGGANKIIVGSGVAKNLGVKLGQYIHVDGGRGVRQPFRLVGITHFGDDATDKSLAFAQLTQVQTLNRTLGRVAQIAVALVDIEESDEMADFWQMLGRDKVEDWKEANKRFMEMIQVQDFVRYFITTAVLIVAAFGIYNVLTIMIAQKKREIAILRSIGYAPARILELVLYQGLVLGIGGGVLGIALGYLMCVWVGSLDFGFEIGGSNHLPISYDASIYVTAFGAALAASVVASFLPARSASRMTPMDIIRSES